MDSKILSVNISNVCIEVYDTFELNEVTINHIVEYLQRMFLDSETLKNHITTVYDDDNDILYHVQDGKVTYSQNDGAKTLEKLEGIDV